MINNIEQHRNTLDFMHDTYVSKNHDYGNSFSKSIEEWGVVAGLVRIEDKWNRLKNLLKGDISQKVDESLYDTCIDAANYFVMLAMELENKKSKDDQLKFEETIKEESEKQADNEENETSKYQIISVAGDCEYMVPNVYADKYDIAAIISFRNAKRTNSWIADEIGVHPITVANIFSKIKKVGE